MRILHVMAFMLFAFSVNAQKGLKWPQPDKGYFYIPSGSFSMGQTDSESDFSQTSRTRTVSIQAFEVSKLVNVREYMAFVEDQRTMRGSEYADMLMPDPSRFPSTAKFHKYLTDAAFQNEPIIGISWENATAYIHWKNGHSSDQADDQRPDYRMITEAEWEYAYDYLQGEKEGDLNKCAEWTSTSYDESMYEFSQDLNPDYTYYASPCDHISRKRKVVRGNSFLYSFETPKSRRMYGYQDSSYRHVGFRLARTHLYRPDVYTNIESDDPYQKHVDMRIVEKLYGQEGMIRYMEGDTLTFESSKWKTTLVTKNGMLNGKYESNYSSGALRVEGQYQFNQRVGEWKFYDQSGKLALSRRYTNNWVYKREHPTPQDALGELMTSEPLYSMVRRDHSKPYSFPYVQARAVYYSKRYWMKNVQLPEMVWRSIKEGVDNRSLTIFTSDQFQDTLTNDSAKQIIRNLPSFSLERDIASTEIVGYQIKGDCFFDVDRLTGEWRTIAIAPEVKSGDSTRSVFWIYYPEIRSLLAKKCTPPKKFPRYIRNLDDVLFFHYFTGDIYRFSNVYGRPEPKDKDPMLSRVELIELEHDLLLHFFAKPKE